MTPYMSWTNIEIDHVKPICMFDSSKDEELGEISCWKNIQPLLEQDHQQKGIKCSFFDYQLQFIRAFQFTKLNVQEDLFKIFFDEIYSKASMRRYPTIKKVYNHIDEIWSIDLAEFAEYNTSNNKGVRYIFIIIDKISENLWCLPL